MFGQSPNHFRLLFVETDIFEQQHITYTEFGNNSFNLYSNTINYMLDPLTQQLAECYCERFCGKIGIEVFRASKMRDQDNFRTTPNKL